MMSQDFEDNYLPPPPEFDQAPAWAFAIWRQQRKDQHRMATEMMRLQGDIQSLRSVLGQKPDSDGQNGKGLLGDVQSLMALRAQGMGFIAAIGLTGALLIAGLAHWLQGLLAEGAK